MQATLTVQELEKFTALAYEETGIRISSQKMELMQNRLIQRLRELNLSSFHAYYEYLKKNWATELPNFIEKITTNETYFFRCPRHFYLLSKHVYPQLPAGDINIWSAASSSGEEPYSLAISVLERMPNVQNRKVRVYASDIDRQVLKKASEGIYGDYALRFVRPEHLKKYFTPINNGNFQVKSQLREMLLLGQHNLKQVFPKGKLDIIFCRNVLIYFDEASKTQVLNNLFAALKVNGYLFLGESEIIPSVSGISRIEASVAQKVSY